MISARHPAHGYVVAVAATALAIAARELADPWLGDARPLVTLYGAVAAAVWFGGWRPALLSVVLGVLVANYLFVAPRATISFNTPVEVIGTLAYLVTCSLVIGFGELMRRAQRQAHEQRELVSITLASIGDAVIATDLRGRVTSMNGVAEALTGWRQLEAVGQPIDAVFRIVDDSTREAAPNPVLRALRDGRVTGLAGHTLLIRRDGLELQVDDSAAPIRGVDGRAQGCVIVFRDITMRRAEERQVSERLDAARLHAAIVSSSEDAIVSKSLQGVIQTWNAGAERLYGYQATEAVGRHISLIIPKDRLSEEDGILRQIHAGQRIEPFNTVRQRKDGSTVHVSLSVSPVLDERGRVVGVSKIARDISAQREAEQRVARLMADLRDADRRKDEFLATLAHELRGPLAPVRNSLEVLKRPASDGRLLERARTMLDRQITHMERLVDDLLDIARITRNRLELRTQRVDLRPLLAQAVEAAYPSAEEAGHALEFDNGGESLEVMGDPVRLLQVFGNLLHNANKYTDRGGRIELRARRWNGLAEVTVRDNGVGIPPDLLPKVFELFAQLEENPGRTQGGLGLGLTIVKQLVEMHGGRVEAHSGGPGLGSEFVVRLPLAKPAALPVAAPRAETANAPLAARRVLVVDDLEDSAESLAMLLRLDGHDVHVANDGPAALEAAERLRPELLLLDVGLPGLSGLEVCRRIRKEPWGRDVRIVALTGWGQDEDRRQTEEAGFDAHLVKPVHPDELREILRPAAG
ncbi:MAG TPA: PAS domain S-box protein [Myxococcota bacterium]|nr:PAS domain S-box protein [Myxococcota bacterium]